MFTAVYDERGRRGAFAARHPNTSFLQRVRPTSQTFRPLLPLYPHAIESFDLRGYDTVISSSSAWSHGVLVDPGALHVCYCHNPFRYAWTERERRCAPASARPPRAAPAAQPLAPVGLDRRPAGRPLRRQLPRHRGADPRYFGREATVLHPPVETGRFHPAPVGDHYMVLAELMAHKRIDVAVRAFNALGRRLLVVGDGPESAAAAAHRRADGHVHGRVSDERSPSCSPARGRWS